MKGLPTPFDLTNDPRRDQGGDLLEFYDLELEKRTALSTVLKGVKEVFTPVLNTVKEDEIVNIIEYSGDELEGVNVLSPFFGEKENILKVATPGSIKEDFQKNQGGNGQGNQVDALFKGFENSLL